MPNVKDMEVISENGIRVKVISCDPSPEETVWYAMHQCYADHFSYDDPLPDTYEEALEKRILNPNHFGPFEHPHLVVNIGGVSRVLMAQLRTHRTGISFDVQSLRYTTIEDIAIDDGSFVIPPYLNEDGKTRVRFKGGIEIDNPDRARLTMLDAYSDSLHYYHKLIEKGVPAEDARFVLPLGIKINMVMSCNARTLMHLLDMRMPANAQWEIRELMESLLEIGKAWMPTTFNWYEEKRARKHKLAP